MLEKSKSIKHIDKDYLYQFIPREYKYLTKVKKIEYNGINLKTDYLINIMHELIIKFFFTNDVKFNLWSVILRKKYGKYYNYYINYLVEMKFMFMVSNYYVARKAKTFKLNITELDIIKCVVNDNILIKKHKKEYLERTFTSLTNSPIDLEIRRKLIDIVFVNTLKYMIMFQERIS